MVNVVTDDWQQVPEPPLDFLDPAGELRQPRGKIGEALGFELLVVHDDVAAVAEGIAQRRDECKTGIIGVGCQEFEMLGSGARPPLHMNTPLKWKVIVWPHARKPRNCRTHCLEVREVQRVSQPLQLFVKLWAKPPRSALHAVARTAESSREWIVLRYVVDRLDAEGDEL